MNEYIFVLGQARELCQAEVKSVLAREKITHKSITSSLEIFHISTSKPLDVNYLIQTLGGTIKIAEGAGVLENGNARNLGRSIPGILCKLSTETRDKKIIFGLSGYGNIHSNDINHWSALVKDELENTGFKVRFILPHNGLRLSSVVIKKQKVQELIIVSEKEKFVLGRTLVVQDFEDWGRRDFGRPAPDPHRGMLPPKVARMMVNIGMSNVKCSALGGSNVTVVDPFCGVGTILAEGMILGMNVIGGDQSQEAIEKTRKNLEWLEKSWNMEPGTWNILQSEATHISQKLPHGSIEAIVTEPYLGPTKIENLENIILGLEKLYLGCFRDWWKILKPQGTIVIALPSFRIDKGEFFVKKPIDICENLGYTLVSGPYRYSRPQAVVIRNIYVLTKK
jgi:tRNA G10  N-methylase Trm11